MGKALVFDGITVSNPLQTLTFSDGVSAVVRQYLANLSTSVPDAHAEAFDTFYHTLKDAGIWNKITCLYPLYGSASDCTYGLIGNPIAIPAGATYDKGLNLTNASGGFGADGKGIKILDYFPSTTTTNYSMFVNYPYGWTTSQRGYPLVFARDSVRDNPSTNSPGRFLGQAWNSTNSNFMDIRASLASEAGISNTLRYTVAEGSKGLFGETHSFSSGSGAHYLYYEGTAVASNVGSAYTAVDNNGKLGINASAQASQTSHLMNVPINMVIVCNGYALSSSDVATLSTAVAALVDVIF